MARGLSRRGRLPDGALPVGPTPLSRARGVFLLVLLNAVAVVTALSIVEFWLARREVPAAVRYSVYPPDQVTTVRVDPRVTPGVHGDAEFRVNELGTRGPLPSSANARRILAIGGSTTECFVLSLEESWPHRLGVLLSDATGSGIWVGNIARAGRNSRQHYFDATYVAPQFGRVDLALLLVGINDLFNRMIQGNAFEPADVVELESEGDYLHTALHVGAAAAGAWDFHLVRRGRRLMERLELMVPANREIRRLLSHTLPDYYANARAMRAARGITIDTIPPMSEALSEFERNLTLIIARLRGHGIEPVLITQPALWRDGLTEQEDALLWLGSADGWPPNREAGPYYSVDAMERMLRLYNDTLRRVALTEHAPFIDLASIVTSEVSWFYDDIHFNEAGADRAARALAEALLEDPTTGAIIGAP